jgi:hypothetical protein
MLLLQDFSSPLTVVGNNMRLRCTILFFPKGLPDFKIAWNFPYDTFFIGKLFPQNFIKNINDFQGPRF